jgi:hypothetical protein
VVGGETAAGSRAQLWDVTRMRRIAVTRAPCEAGRYTRVRVSSLAVVAWLLVASLPRLLWFMVFCVVAVVAHVLVFAGCEARAGRLGHGCWLRDGC